MAPQHCPQSHRTALTRNSIGCSEGHLSSSHKISYAFVIWWNFAAASVSPGHLSGWCCIASRRYCRRMSLTLALGSTSNVA